MIEKQNKLSFSLYSAFEAEPFENGMDHPADQIIEHALRFSRDERTKLEQFSALLVQH